MSTTLKRGLPAYPAPTGGGLLFVVHSLSPFHPDSNAAKCPWAFGNLGGRSTAQRPYDNRSYVRFSNVLSVPIRTAPRSPSGPFVQRNLPMANSLLRRMTYDL